MENLQGRVAFVTGCGREAGIGAATARILAERGALVAVADIGANREALAAFAEKTNLAVGRQALLPVEIDLRSESSCREAVARSVQTLGGLDILVNNAGAPQGADRADLTEVDEAAWSFVIDVNLTGAFRITKAALPHLRRSPHGRIVSIASVAAIRSLFDRVAYAASKAGILGYTTSLAGDLAPDGVTVNAVSPGSVDTGRDVVRSLGEKSSTMPVYSWSPLGRVASNDDIGNAIAFLSSDDAAYITGHNLVVDGGLSVVLRRG